MSESAFQTQYRQESIAAFEQTESLLRMCCTTEAVFKGNTAVFLVVGSGGATAVSRGLNGMIPARNNDLDQFSCVLSEWHDLVRMTSFNIFASQGNQREQMQRTTVAVVNRKIDSQIIDELNTGTVTVGAASAIPTFSMWQNGRVKLSNAAVPMDNNWSFVTQPSFIAFMEQAPEFSNMQWVDVKPLAGGDNASWRDKVMAYRYRNVLIVEHPNLPGKATASEKSFLFHKSAIGHAADTSGMNTEVGYNGEQAYSWARASLNMGAKLLQNTGVVVFTSDGTTYG